MKTAVFLLIAMASWPATAPAQPPIVLTGVQDGSYVLTVRGGVVTLTPAIVVTPGGVVIPIPPAPPIPPVPPGPDPPTPPPAPVTSGVAYLVVIRNNQDLTADQAATLAHLRRWSDSQPAKVSHLEIPPDAGGLDARLKTYIDKAGDLPWVVISRARTDGVGAAVLWSGPLPDTHEALIATFQEVVK